MSNSNQKMIAGAVIVVAVAAAGYFLWNWRSTNSVDNPEGFFYVCQNPQCRNEFSVSEKDDAAYQKAHYGEPRICPKCGQKNVVDADRCPTCKRMYPKSGRSASGCPFCNKKPAPGGSAEPRPD